MHRLTIQGFRVFVAVAGIIMVGTTAHAFDVTGTWEGTYACKGTDGEKDSYVSDVVANITQAGTAIGANVTIAGNPYKYNGIAVASTAKPDKGDLMLVLCGTDDDSAIGSYDELGRFSVVTKPSKGTGAIKGASLYSSPSPSAYTCKWKLKRINTTNANVTAACP